MENEYSKNRIFQVLSEIPLDIEGSNLANTGYYPAEFDKNWMSDNDYAKCLEEAYETDSKVLFTNIYLEWDSCDCSEGMCSHGAYVVGMRVVYNDDKIEIDMWDGDTLGSTHNGTFSMPSENTTVYDFYRMCELVGITLKFSEYAKSLLNNQNKTI
ncbi:hypothetical protein HZQ61_02940 [Elizabethkingia anophelis]|nr:hypothetical protein [Elizabethkingia anophelis]